MQHTMRDAVAVVVAVSVVLLAGPPAQATTVSPIGSVTATATAADLTHAVSGAGSSCTGSSITDQLNGNGSSTIALGDATFSGCSGFTIIQVAGWTNQIAYNGGNPTVGLTVPAGGLEMTSILGACTFRVGGTVTSDPASSTTLSGFTFSDAGGLVVTRVDPLNACFGLIYVADSVLFDATYMLGTAVTVGP